MSGREWPTCDECSDVELQRFDDHDAKGWCCPSCGWSWDDPEVCA